MPERESDTPNADVPRAQKYYEALTAIDARGGRPTTELARKLFESIPVEQRSERIPAFLEEWRWREFMEPVYDEFVGINKREIASFYGIAIRNPDSADDELPVHPRGHQFIVLKEFRQRSATGLVRWSDIDPDALKRPNAVTVMRPDEIAKTPEQEFVVRQINETFVEIQVAALEAIRLLTMSKDRREKRLKYPHLNSPELIDAVTDHHAAQSCYQQVCATRAKLLAAVHLSALGAAVYEPEPQHVEYTAMGLRCELEDVYTKVPQEIWDIEHAWTTRLVRWLRSVGEMLHQWSDRLGR